MAILKLSNRKSDTFAGMKYMSCEVRAKGDQKRPFIRTAVQLEDVFADPETGAYEITLPTFSREACRTAPLLRALSKVPDLVRNWVTQNGAYLFWEWSALRRTMNQTLTDQFTKSLHDHCGAPSAKGGRYLMIMNNDVRTLFSDMMSASHTVPGPVGEDAIWKKMGNARSMYTDYQESPYNVLSEVAFHRAVDINDSPTNESMRYMELAEQLYHTWILLHAKGDYTHVLDEISRHGYPKAHSFCKRLVLLAIHRYGGLKGAVSQIIIIDADDALIPELNVSSTAGGRVHRVTDDESSRKAYNTIFSNQPNVIMVSGSGAAVPPNSTSNEHVVVRSSWSLNNGQTIIPISNREASQHIKITNIISMGTLHKKVGGAMEVDAKIF